MLLLFVACFSSLQMAGEIRGGWRDLRSARAWPTRGPRMESCGGLLGEAAEILPKMF